MWEGAGRRKPMVAISMNLLVELEEICNVPSPGG